MDREPQHLREMAHRRLAAIVLPVGVGDEAHRRIEGEIGGDRIEALRVQRQKILEALDQIERNEADDAEGQHRHRIGDPALFARRIDAGELVEAALDRHQHRAEECPLARQHASDVARQRYRGRQHESENNDDL